MGQLTSRQLPENQNYKYKFSVVIPIYNTEKYLEETIESIIGQTIGFRDNIQLILVNNATEDDSGEICERYLAKYPENVVYIKLKENRGPSGARNVGIPYVKGKYVNFLDSDDKWAFEAFKKIYSFFEKHYDEIDVVACRIKHFDATDAWHGLDRKFQESKIISILDDYSFVQLSLCSTIIKGEVLPNFRLDERVRHAEDAKFLTEILLKKPKYALLREVVFYYRTRKTGTSVLQTVSQSKSWYFDTPKYVFEYLLDLSIKEFGNAIPYVQYLVMYELQWRLKTPLPDFLTEEERISYKNTIFRLIKRIDDHIIWEQLNLWREYKIYALSIKYKKKIDEEFVCNEEAIYFNDLCIYPARTPSSLEICIVTISKDVLYIEGRFSMVLSKNKYTFMVSYQEKKYECETFYLDESTKRFSLGEQIHEIIGFKVHVPLNTEQSGKIIFQLQYGGSTIPLGFHFSFICKLTQKAKKFFWHCGNYILRPNESTILVEPYSKKLVRRLERKLDGELIQKRCLKLLLWRWLIIVTNWLLKKRKPIWLVIDSFDTADDNGEFFFRYLMQNDCREIRPYFVVSRSSKDYARMKKIGPVIAAETKRYRLMFALADKIISSRSFYNKLNTFHERTELLQDQFHFDFVYLQHGVIKDNHADTQSRHKKDFALFITSAEKEKESIIKGIGGNYCYDERVVKVTGLARHDAILQAECYPKRNKILLAPTWRMEGVGAWDEQAQTYTYSESFKKTKFFNFYQNLINEPEILNALHTYGYTMTVRFHPRTIQQASDFVPGEGVTIEYEQGEYVQEIQETALLITDYSSIAFDYAYFNIPTIYTQFDVNTFYLKHGYKRGYFEYEQDGFGPVCYDYDSTVQTIIKAIESGCVMEEKYHKRAEEFFAYRDGKNCERIYNEILKLDEGA